MNQPNPMNHHALWSKGEVYPVAGLIGLASLPVVFWSAQLWVDGILGGIASAIMSVPICAILAILTMRQPRWRETVYHRRHAESFLIILGLAYALTLWLARSESNWLLLSGITLVPMIWVTTWGAFGWSRALQLTLPLTFLFFALPWEHFLRDLIDAPLQAWTADIALQFLEVIGYHLHYWNDHTIYTEKYYVIVNETCSGMNLLVTLTMYILIFGWLTQPEIKHRILLLFLVFPLAMLANGLRVATIYLLGHYGGNELADGFWHTGSAYVLFLPVFWFVYVVNNALLRRSYDAVQKTDPPQAAKEVRS